MECTKESATCAVFTTSPVECRDENDERYERCYKLVRSLTDGVSEKDAHDALNTNNARGAQAHEDAAVGLLVSILSSGEAAATKFRDLTLTSRDGLASVITQLQYLVVEKYGRLQDGARQQLLWLIRQLIRNSVNGTDGVCWNLMRQIVGGDISPKNVWLAESLLDIFIENRSWLEKHQFLTASVVYCYLRIIEDHFPPQFQQLRDKEAAFIVQLLRERFADCIIIGRELVRLLQHVARVPGIDALWRDLLHNPGMLMPNFTGLLQLLQSRTSRRFLPCRLTPDMEKKIVFLMSHVRFGSQKRYQEWFQKQYLSTPESQSLRCDLIRFIVGVIHPTNELLSSDIIPRWAVIGWLLTTCTSQVALANAKLALFFDWLFYDAEKDNIMNIEPAVLVMHHSLRPRPAITATLLDFMCRIIPTFYPPLADRVAQGMYTALRQIVKMRVLPSLEPLFINAKLDKELRRLLKERFAEFCATADGGTSGLAPGGKMDDSDSSTVNTSGDAPLTPSVGFDPPTPAASSISSEHAQSVDEPVFSDDEDCCEVKPPTAATTMSLTSAVEALRPTTPVASTIGSNLGASIKQDLHMSEEDVFGDKYSEAWDELIAPLRKQLDKLRHETNSEFKCEAVESICQTVCDGEISEDSLSSLSLCLVTNFHSTLTQPVFPPEEQVTAERLDESIRQPLFVLLRGVCDCSAGHPCRSVLTSLVAALCQHSDRVAHLLLYYIVVRTQKDEKDVRDRMFDIYKDLCTARESDRSLSDHLIEDVQVCVDVEPAMLVWLVPALYSHLPSVCVGNAELLRLVVCRLDGRQLLQLVSHAVCGELVLFRRDSFVRVVDASLEWETFEQCCLWQLVEAHELTIDYIVPLITRLDCQRHWEAVTALLLMLKREEPCMELMKPLMQRSYDDTTSTRDGSSPVPSSQSSDLLVSSVLQYWVLEYQQQTAELIANLVNRSSLTPNKRKRTNTAAATPRSSPHLPSTDLLLQHLDRLRRTLNTSTTSSTSSFWSIDEVQTALSVAQSGCGEVQRQRFAALFALVDVDDDSASRTRRARKAAARSRAGAGTGGSGSRSQSRAASAAAAASSVVDDSSDSDQSTEDEQVKKPSRKRRKNNQLNSDSD